MNTITKLWKAHFFTVALDAVAFKSGLLLISDTNTGHIMKSMMGFVKF